MNVPYSDWRARMSWTVAMTMEHYSDKESLEDVGKSELCMVVMVSTIVFNYFDGQKLTICLLKNRRQ